MPDLLRVPPAYQAPLRTLSKLSRSKWDLLVDDFDSVPQQLTAPDLADRLAKIAPSLKQEAATALSALLSLVTLVENTGRDIEAVAKDVSASPDLKIPADRRGRFSSSLRRLLCADALRLVARAGQVLTDHEHIYQSARVLTDVRPVFRDDISEPPAGAVIVEMLKIEYVASDRTDSSFYVALDYPDLVNLKKVVDRALAKTETLKRFLSDSGLSYYEYQEMPNASTD